MPTPPPRDTPTGQQGAMQKRLQQLPVFARELLAGGAAGGLAKTCVAPLERTKIIFQTRGGKMTVSGVLQHIWHNEGVPGLFRGNTASVLRIVPYAAIHFGSYEYIRRFIVQLAGAEGGHGPDAPSALPVYDLLAGSASGAIAVIATYPLDLVRTRLAWATEAPAQQQLAAVAAAGGVRQSVVHQQPGIWATLRGTMAEEGLAGLYRGCTPTLLGILPYAGLKFYVYQKMKNRYRSWQIQEDKRQQQEKQQQQQQQQQPKQEQQQEDVQHLPPAPPFETALQQADLAEEEQLQRPQKLPVSVTLLFGGVAGLVAQTVTYPLDVIRRQMQVSHLQIAAQARSQAQAASNSSSGGAGSSSGSGSGSSMPGAGSQHTRGVQAPSSSSSSSARQLGSMTGCSTAPAGAHTQSLCAASQAQPLQASTSYSHSSPGSTSSSSRQFVWSMSGSSNSSSIRQQLRYLGSSCATSAAGKPAAAAAAAADPSMADVALRLWRSGGMFRGLSINYLKVVPSTAIGFTVYDYLKAYLGLTHT